MRKIHEKDTGALKTFWGSLMVPDFSDSEDLGESLHEHVIRCLDLFKGAKVLTGQTIDDHYFASIADDSLELAYAVLKAGANEFARQTLTPLKKRAAGKAA